MPSQQITIKLPAIVNEITINGISYPNPTPGIPGGTITVPEADGNALFDQGGVSYVSDTAT